MPNSIRTPKQGLTEASRHIAEAVDDEQWQKFRRGLKGLPTRTKLDLLRDYSDMWNDDSEASDKDIVNVNIRVENYLRALARGGQIEPVSGRSEGWPRDIGRYHQFLLENRIVIRK